MKKTYMIAGSLLSGILIAGMFSATAFAWHPKGTIKKLVQNQTTGSALSDANTAATAVASKPGDVLKYVIQVSNTGSADSRGWNDMAHTVMTDTLPAGVALVDNPTQRTISVDLGTIKPGKTETREYLVRVTSVQNGAVIENKACFTGNSEVNDNAQSGCDVAIVTVAVPVPPVTPPVVPVPPVVPPVVTPELPKELPHTGPANAFGLFAGVSGLGYGLRTAFLRLKRQ